MSKVYVFSMAMTCEGCVNAAKKVLSRLEEEGMEVDASLETKTVTVKSSLDADVLLTQLQKTGKEIQLVETK